VKLSEACFELIYPPRNGRMKVSRSCQSGIGNYEAIDEPPFSICSTSTMFNCLMKSACFIGESSFVNLSATI